MTNSAPAGAAARRRIVDLSHVITDGLVTYPGIPGPVIGSHLTFDESASHYAAGTEFSIGTISMAANTGTYLDTPAHRYRDGEDLAALSLDRMVDLDGVVVRARVRSGAGGRSAKRTCAAHSTVLTWRAAGWPDVRCWSKPGTAITGGRRPTSPSTRT